MIKSTARVRPAGTRSPATGPRTPARSRWSVRSRLRSAARRLQRERRPRRRFPPTVASRSWRRLSASVVVEGAERHVAQGPGEQAVGQRGVPASTGPWRYVPTTRPCTAPSLPSPSPLPTPATTRPGGGPPQRRRAPMVLEAGQRRQRSEHAGPPRPAPRPPPADRSASPCRRRGARRPRADRRRPGKVRPTIWNPAQTASTTAPSATRRASVPSSMSVRGGPDLGTVLSPAQAVEVGLRQGAVGDGLQQLDLVAPPFGPPGQHQAVAAVAVGAQQVGVDDGDAQRGVIGAPSRSWNACSSR